MNSKEAIVANWLPRYTGSAAADIAPYVLLTNFSGYLDTFAALTGATLDVLCTDPGTRAVARAMMVEAQEIAERLGVTDHFEDIFDIVRSKLLPKPNRETYDGFIAETGIDPARAAMFEDLSRNLAVPAALGMRTVLVVPGGTREVFHEEWEAEGRDEPHVEFLTDDLGAFLDKVLEAIAAPHA